MNEHPDFEPFAGHLPMREADGQAGEDVLPDVLDRLRLPQSTLPFPTEPRLIGPFLKDLRIRLGITQQQVADKCTFGQSVVSYLENGHKAPLFYTVMAYLSAIGCSLGVVRDGGESIPERKPLPRGNATREKSYSPRPAARKKMVSPSGRVYVKSSTGRCLGCFKIHPDGQEEC